MTPPILRPEVIYSVLQKTKVIALTIVLAGCFGAAYSILSHKTRYQSIIFLSTSSKSNLPTQMTSEERISMYNSLISIPSYASEFFLCVKGNNSINEGVRSNIDVNSLTFNQSSPQDNARFKAITKPLTIVDSPSRNYLSLQIELPFSGLGDHTISLTTDCMNEAMTEIIRDRDNKSINYLDQTKKVVTQLISENNDTWSQTWAAKQSSRSDILRKLFSAQSKLLAKLSSEEVDKVLIRASIDPFIGDRVTFKEGESELTSPKELKDIQREVNITYKLLEFAAQTKKIGQEENAQIMKILSEIIESSYAHHWKYITVDAEQELLLSPIKKYQQLVRDRSTNPSFSIDDLTLYVTSNPKLKDISVIERKNTARWGIGFLGGAGLSLILWIFYFIILELIFVARKIKENH